MTRINPDILFTLSNFDDSPTSDCLCQRSILSKEKMKLLKDLAAQREMNSRPRDQIQTLTEETDLIVVIAILGGSLIGVIIAVCACYFFKCRKQCTEGIQEFSNYSKHSKGTIYKLL